MNSLSSSHGSFNQSTGPGQASRGEASRERASPGSCFDNKVLLIDAHAVKAFLLFKQNGNDIYAEPVKAIYKSLSWRQVEALENIANVYLSYCAILAGENSSGGNMELYVNTEDYEQLLVFESMLTR